MMTVWADGRRLWFGDTWWRRWLGRRWRLGRNDRSRWSIRGWMLDTRSVILGVEVRHAFVLDVVGNVGDRVGMVGVGLVVEGIRVVVLAESRRGGMGLSWCDTYDLSSPHIPRPIKQRNLHLSTLQPATATQATFLGKNTGSNESAIAGAAVVCILIPWPLGTRCPSMASLNATPVWFTPS